MTVFGRPVSALELGGWAVGLVGLFNLAGSLIWAGSAAGTPKKDMLALLYALRALAFVMFLALLLSWLSVPSHRKPSEAANTSTESHDNSLSLIHI